jgi:ATP-dependent protease ClpP protease subunit
MSKFVKVYRSPFLSRNVKKQPKKVVNEDDFELDPLKSLFGVKDDVSEKEKNHIYFYGDVTQDSCLDLNRKINSLNKELLKHAIEYDCEPPHIYLHINSGGGDLLAAFSTVDVIKNSMIPIISIVEGSAASAATIISMVCHKRYITENSFMLIHQLSSGMCGKYEELKDDFENDTKFMDLLYNLYSNHTTMENKEIKKILARDIWLSSKECLERGLVDDFWKPISGLYVRYLFKEGRYTTEKNEKEEKSESKIKKSRR